MFTCSCYSISFYDSDIETPPLYFSDGCSKSGIFVALRLILEKLAIDDEIDVFQVVRTIQVRRPEFLMNFVSFQ